MIISKLLRKGGGEEQEWELPTSMIDVVFLLLIFFMCASRFRTVEKRLDAFLPNRGPGRETVSAPPEVMTIKVSNDSRHLKMARFRIAGWQTTDPNRLAAHLRQIRATGKFSVEIDGGQDCSFRHVMAALDACVRAKFTDVSFSAPALPGYKRG